MGSGAAFGASRRGPKTTFEVILGTFSDYFSSDF